MNKILILIYILLCAQIVAANTIIYDPITPNQYKSVTIDDISNINYLDSYKYKIFINDTYYGEYAKGEQIIIPDNSSIKIIIPANIKQTLSANNFVSIISVGFYSFMQYGIYIIIIIFVLYWILQRKRR